MNWANRITIIRLVLIPVICVLMTLPAFYDNTFHGTQWGKEWFLNIGTGSNKFHLSYAYLAAGIIFVVASLTDMLDGYIARKYNQVTTFGKFFDAIADKLLTNSVLIIFAVGGIIPIWMTIILICRDFLIDVVRQILASSNVVMEANKLGKYRAAFEMFGMTILFFVGFRNFGGAKFGTGTYDELGWINQVIMIPMYISTLLSVVSAINYIVLNRKELFAGIKKEKKAKNEVKK